MAKKTFNQVKLNVAFTVATTRENIANNENISIMSGKIAKWYDDFHPCVWDGNAAKVNGHTVGVNVPANAKFTDTTYSVMTAATTDSAGKAGLVPAPAAGKQTAFLRGDGTWVVPTNTTYSNFVKSGTGAKAGLVPAPSTTAGTTKYLREDGTWAVPPNTNTDTLVRQAASTTTNFRPIILGQNNSTDPSTLADDVTNQVYTTTKVYVKPSTGDIYTEGHLFVPRGIYASNGDPDSSGHTMLVGHNGSNLWIGAYDSTSPQHLGRTFISAGYDNTNKKGYESLKILVPNNANDGGTSYDVLHTGNTYHNITSSNDLWSTIGVSTVSGYVLKVIRGGSGSDAPTPPAWFATKYGAGIVFGGIDTKGVLSIGQSSPKVTIAGGSNTSTQTKPVWYMSLTGTTGKTYNLDNFSTTSHTHNYLPLSGGTMTGNIKYKTATRTSNLFIIDDANENGSMYTGPHTGALTVIGSGESVGSIRAAIFSDDGLSVPATASSKFTPESESLILSSDSSVYIMIGCNTMADRKAIVFSSAGNLYPGINETSSVGTSSYKWNAMYAKTFYGALSGNATSASKWATARTITLGTGLQGSVSLDGSANITLNGSLKRCLQYDDTSDFASYAWHKFAEVTITSTNADHAITFLVSKTWSSVPTSSGILTLHLRSSSTRIFESAQFMWERAGSGIDPNNFVMVYTNTADTSVKAELWYKQTTRYDGWSFTVLKEHTRAAWNASCVLFTTTGHGSANHTTGTGTITSSLVTIQNPTTSANKLSTSRAIDGVNFDGSASITHYGSCSTAAATVAKVVSCAGFTLVTGAKITVKFTVTNTAANPTLNVNSTGAKPIYYRGAAITTGYLAANRTYTFCYNGTQYDLVGDINTNTDTKVTVTGIKTNVSTNYGIKRPLLFAASTANPNNELSTATDDVLNGCKATTYTGGVAMNGGIYIETNYWTTGDTGSYVKLHLPNGGFVVGNLTGNVTGTASRATRLEHARTINGVSFDGDSNISITKRLYSGTGAATVTLTDSQSNYDLLIIVTNVGTLLHRVGKGVVSHTFCNYPTPSQNGTKTVDLCNVSTIDTTDKKITATVSAVKLTGSGTTATAASFTQVVNITEVYGLKLS